MRWQPGQIFGPDGVALTLEALPRPGQVRWSRLRKARVVAAVRNGLLALDEACARYAMSVDEFIAWESTLLLHGAPGLRATNVREHESAARIDVVVNGQGEGGRGRRRA